MFNTNTIHNIDEALLVYQDDIAERFIAHVHNRFDTIVKDLGPNLKNIHNDWNYAKEFSRTIEPYVTWVGNSNKLHDGIYVINDEVLEKKAKQYALDIILQCANKIKNKLQDLDEAQCNSFNGFWGFTITGLRNGHRVHIEQNTIINSRGTTLFNQFPARIYVDGKLVSEVQYKNLFGEKRE